MSRFALSSVVVVCFLLAVPFGNAQQNTISVSGDAEIRVVPDEVILTVGVETFNKNLAVAKQFNDEKIASALAVAKKFAVPERYVQTDYISVEPKYRNSDVTSELLGYAVRKSIVIRFRDIPHFEALLTSLLESGVTHVHGIEFRTTELRKYRDQARELAMKAAREKAQAMAAAVGKKADKALSVSESGGGWWAGYNSWWGARWNQYGPQNVAQERGGESSEEAALAPGQISVRSTVSANFLLE